MPRKKLKIKRKPATNESEAVLVLLFFISLILVVWGMSIFRMTVISTGHLIATVAIGTIISFALMFFLDKGRYSILFEIGASIVIGGGFFYFWLLYINKFFAAEKTITDEFQIIQTGNMGRGRGRGCSQPYAVIDFKGRKKKLLFNCEYEEKVAYYSRVKVTYSSGFFGFDIIKSTQLIE